MHPRAQRHALLFRRLIEECGGYSRVMELKVTRLQKPAHLYRFGDALSGSFAPMDVVEDLELFCGRSLYTAALADGLPGSVLIRDILKEACETSVSVAELMRLVMVAKEMPGGISPRAQAAILSAIDAAADELRQVREAALQEAPAGVADLGVRRAP